MSTPDPDDTVAFVAEQLSRQQGVAALVAALDRQTVYKDVPGELTGIVTELYDTLARNRRALKLLDRAAVDHPALAQVWFSGAREGVVGLPAEYLRTRGNKGQVRSAQHPLVVARICLETLSFWAIHRHWDPHPQAVSDDVAKDEAIRFVVAALLAP